MHINQKQKSKQRNKSSKSSQMREKWNTFKEFNDASQEAPSFGFDFDLDEMQKQIDEWKATK